MPKKIIYSDQAPAPVGPYSQAVKVGTMIFTAGQIPLNLEGKVVEGGVKEQTHQVFANLKAVLAKAGSSLDDVVKTTVFLKDLNDFAEMNGVYAEYFKEAIAPARSTIQVAKLPLDVLVEIEVVAEASSEYR